MNNIMQWIWGIIIGWFSALLFLSLMSNDLSLIKISIFFILLGIPTFKGLKDKSKE